MESNWFVLLCSVSDCSIGICAFDVKLHYAVVYACVDSGNPIEKYFVTSFDLQVVYG